MNFAILYIYPFMLIIIEHVHWSVWSSLTALIFARLSRDDANLLHLTTDGAEPLPSLPPSSWGEFGGFLLAYGRTEFFLTIADVFQHISARRCARVCMRACMHTIPVGALYVSARMTSRSCRERAWASKSHRIARRTYDCTGNARW